MDVRHHVYLLTAISQCPGAVGSLKLVEVAVLGSSPLIVRTVSVDVKQHRALKLLFLRYHVKPGSRGGGGGGGGLGGGEERERA